MKTGGANVHHVECVFDLTCFIEATDGLSLCVEVDLSNAPPSELEPEISDSDRCFHIKAFKNVCNEIKLHILLSV